MGRFADMISEQEKQQHVVADHACPGRYQTQPQKSGTDEGAHNAYGPHADEVVEKRPAGFAHSLHHALHHNGNAVEGF